MQPILMRTYRSIYVPIPKVGCTSLKTAFLDNLQVNLGQNHDPHRTEYPVPLDNVFSRNFVYKRFFKFGFVRNPWARIVSCYVDKILDYSQDGYTRFSIRPGVADCLASYGEFYNEMSFDSFVDAIFSIDDARAEDHFRSQYTFFDQCHRGFPVDFIGRLENFSYDWEIIRQKMGNPDIKIPVLHNTGVKNYREFYNFRTQELIRQRYRDDIEQFNYTFK